MIARWFVTFALTLGVELVVALPLLRLVEGRRSRRIALVVIANLITHPVVFVAASLVSSRTGAWGLVAIPILELAATFVEGGVYARVFGRRPALPAFGISAVANAASLFASVVLWTLQGG